jgi:hypothetical protein
VRLGSHLVARKPHRFPDFLEGAAHSGLRCTPPSKSKITHSIPGTTSQRYLLLGRGAVLNVQGAQAGVERNLPGQSFRSGRADAM